MSGTEERLKQRNTFYSGAPNSYRCRNHQIFYTGARKTNTFVDHHQKTMRKPGEILEVWGKIVLDCVAASHKTQAGLIKIGLCGLGSNHCVKNKKKALTTGSAC